MKVRNNDIGRFPWTRPVWRFTSEWRAEGTDGRETGIEEHRVGDCQNPEMRSGVADSV